jgi:DNA mismatch repair protein MutS2
VAPASDRLSPQSIPIPDLLCVDARVRIDARSFGQTLVFAFAAGAPADVVEAAVGRAALPDSSWEVAGFARDLFVGQIVQKGFEVRIDGRAQPTCARYVERVLLGPPRNLADTELRRGVLSEITQVPALRAEAEAAYLAIVHLRAMLCAPRQPAPRVRRMEILRAIRDALALLARSFEGARSALSRLRTFGEAAVGTEEYARLVALLEHDEHQGSLDLRVRVGADGEVRSMELLAVRDNDKNPFYISPLRRWWVRFALMLRGYRTTAGEVAERLLSEALSGVERPVALLFQAFGDLAVYLGAMGFRDHALAKGLSVSLAAIGAPGDALELQGLFNPLLLMSGVTPVAADVRAGPGAIVLVTGPNSGGKTRLLQSIALAQLLSEGGFFVPARAARVPRASGLFASLFEEASADQPEGHLGMELLRIRKLFDDLDAGAIVVLDELCSGTNPSEGEEIARLVLSLLPELGVRAFVTTHLLSFAAELSTQRPSAALEFLQVELDENERPTYRFAPGVARTSLAQRTAERLGVTRGELLDRIAAKRLAKGKV